MEHQIRNDIKERGTAEDLDRVNEIVGEVFQLQDQDKDGVLSKEEFARPPQSHDEL